MRWTLEKLRQLAARILLRSTASKTRLPKYGPRELIAYLHYLTSRARGGKAFPGKNIYTTATLPGGPILVLSPHHDDEAIGMGGSLAIHLEKRSPVTVLYMTDGRGAGRGSEDLTKVRRAEAEAIGREYSIDQIFWDAEDMKLTNDDRTVAAMVEVLRVTQPQMIYVPSFFDHHYDHFAANQILADALERTGQCQSLIVGYEVWDSLPFPNFVVDITDYFDKKTEILKHYATPLRTTDFVLFCKHRGSLHYKLQISGRRGHEGYAEAFHALDCQGYCESFHDYVNALQQNGSRLPSHVQTRRPQDGLSPD